MTTLDEVRTCDADDPLGPFRARFRLPAGLIYLDGNSLGPLPHATADRMRTVIEQEWGDGLIRSWNDRDWIGAPARVGAKIAGLVGAQPDEVIVADSTSVDLFKLVVAAAAARPGAILVEANAFPTDSYIGAGVAGLIGRECRSAPRDRLAEAFTPDVAVAIVTHVDYRSAARHDIAALETAARATGCHIVWDLSHSVGAVPIDLGGDGARLAVGCGYKYLNGGPGAPAFLYVERTLQPLIASPIAGWWSHAAPFDFADAYAPAAGITRFAAGTPPMLGVLALEGGVDLMVEAGVAALWRKAIRLYDLFAARVALRCPQLEIVSPVDPARRGSHIALRHPGAQAIVRAAIARGVVGDFRAPDIARFGLAPLYLSFADIWQAVEVLATVIDTAEWQDPRHASGGVVP